jgi:diadenosine tetraphosphate (Ap4A) HIT family hydrolase
MQARLKGTLEPAGYNVGVNIGEAAGQTIFHLHVHLIPRFGRDVAEPRGGVRNVIPGKGQYASKGALDQGEVRPSSTRYPGKDKGPALGSRP